MLKKIKRKQVFLALLVVLWMTTVFMFSNQNKTKTLNTSGAFINAIQSIFNKKQENLGTNTLNDYNEENNKINEKADEQQEKIEDEQEYNYSNEIQRFTRKNAHYFLYLIGRNYHISFFLSIYKKNQKGSNIFNINRSYLCNNR